MSLEDTLVVVMQEVFLGCATLEKKKDLLIYLRNTFRKLLCDVKIKNL